MNQEILNKFKEVYQEEFNEIISDDEATQKLRELASLLNLIYSPE